MIYRFGVFELDEAAGELRKGGRAVEIQPKPLALLGFLIRERERVVPADELLEVLWPDAIVSSGSLTRAVSHARRALDDTNRGQLLKSISRRGYRFVGDLVEVDASAAESTASLAKELGDSGDFVGRVLAWRQLEGAWQSAAAGSAQIVLVTGPAGIGKTRLTERFASQLEQLGPMVIVARCRDRDGVPAFWVWAQVLRRLAEQEACRHTLQDLADSAELVALVPELAKSPSSPPVVRDLPDELQRFLFYDAVTRALHACAQLRPLVVVLEDIHWASSPSLRLLEHIACERGNAPLLVIATVRDEARAANHPVENTLSMLRHEKDCTEVALAGLSRAEVGALLTHAIGAPPPADLVSELFARTDGIPFFVSEAIRLLDERGDLHDPQKLPRRGVSLPATASDLIRRPLDALSEEAARLLGAGAVVGREFGLAQVAGVADVARAEALDLLDEAIDAGVVCEQSDAVASYRFTHALFQEAIYDRLKTGARAKLHGRAASRLENQHADLLEPVLSELAHHYHRGIAVCDPIRAFEIATQAAQSAQRQFAYEQAATHYEQAVANLEHCDNVEASRRLVTLLALGEAHRLSGERERRREVFQQAMDQARALGSSRDFARAAIGFCVVSEWSPYDAAARASVEEALAGLDDDALAERARLNSRLGYLDVQDRSKAEPRAREALRMARECGNDQALQEAIYVLHYITLGPDGMAERAERIDELFKASLQCQSRDVGMIALLDLAGEALAAGDRARADKLRSEAGELITGYPSPSMQWHVNVFDSGVAQLEGRFEDMQRLAQETIEIGGRIGHPYAKAVFDGQRAVLARIRNEPDESIGYLLPAMNARRGATHWVKAFVGREELRRGNRDAAVALLEDLGDDAFQAIPRNLRWTATLPEIALLCAELEDDLRARQLLELLASAEGQHGVMPMVINYGGPLSRSAGRLWMVLGRVDDALPCYEDGLETATALGAKPMQALIEFEFSQLLERSGDRERASQLREAASRKAGDLSLLALQARMASAAR